MYYLSFNTQMHSCNVNLKTLMLNLDGFWHSCFDVSLSVITLGFDNALNEKKPKHR